MHKFFFTIAILFFGIGISFAQDGTDSKPDKNQNDKKSNVLFDGSSLDQFRGYKDEKIGKGWKIDGDALMFDGTGGGDIMTRESYGDFALMFEWKVEKGSNSGVMYRVSTGDSAPYWSGPEYQILDDDVHRDGKNPVTSAASLYGLYKAEGKQLQPVGQWNTAKIVLNGSKVEHWLNGSKVVDVDMSSDEWKQRKDNSKFKTWEKFAANKRGHICFQDHGDKVWFRNIKVKTMN